MKKAPWTDFEGNPIYQGDEIIHPSGERGIVIYDKTKQKTEKWRVDYAHGETLWLGNQIGDKGLAVVSKQKDKDMTNKLEIIKKGSEFIKIWNRVDRYITSDRFFHLCTRCGVDVPRYASDRNKMYSKFRSFYTCLEFPEKLIEMALEEIDKLKEYQPMVNWRGNRDEFRVKVIFKLDGGKRNEELDLFSPEGVDQLAWIHKNADMIYAQCRLCDKIYRGGARDKENLFVYERDIVHCRNIDNKSTMVTCFYPENYIHPAPTYRELIYSERYGYLTSEGCANIDSNACALDKSMLNMEAKECNDYLIKLNDTNGAEIIGNLAVDLSVLKPTGAERITSP